MASDTNKAPRTDYHKQLESFLKSLHTETSMPKPRLLLHACCAPCSSAVIEYLAAFFSITIYYYNPNIHPAAEYWRRLQELRDFLASFPPAGGIVLQEAAYDPEDFFTATNARKESNLQAEPEKGERCRRCYRLRMERACMYAAEHDYDYVCTTLSISPHKDVEKINAIGQELTHIYKKKFLPSDFKKKNGFLRSLQLSTEYHLYRQDYCGCIYSQRLQKQDKETQT